MVVDVRGDSAWKLETKDSGRLVAVAAEPIPTLPAVLTRPLFGRKKSSAQCATSNFGLDVVSPIHWVACQ
jgi:hypothetical protein